MARSVPASDFPAIATQKQPLPWWFGETVVRINSIPHLLPPLANGNRVALSSMYRWTTRGLRGVRLRRFRVGGAWATTHEELARWQRAVTTLSGGDA